MCYIAVNATNTNYSSHIMIKLFSMLKRCRTTDMLRWWFYDTRKKKGSKKRGKGRVF